MENKSTLFDNYNARYSSLNEVAETFVSNEEFFRIAKNNHTFVLGPRGCGKTTLFKMLTTSAMSNWKPTTIQEDELKRNFPFIAIYIPSDELWKDQLNSILGPLIGEKLKAQVISNALISNNIFLSFCENIKNHINIIDVENKKEKIQNFCKELIEIWELEDCIYSFGSIKLTLSKRRDKFISTLKKYVVEKESKPDVDFDLPDIFYVDFLNSIKSCIISFENVFNDGDELKWALCFDELELLSEDFFEDLKRRLRIAPPNIVFKLSSSPLSDFDGIEAQQSHDYEVVKMWPSNSSEEKRFSLFCENIAKKRITSFRERKSLKKYIDIDFNKIFGSLDYARYALKDFDFKVNLSAKENDPESLTWFVFKELATYDNGFRRFIESRGLDPNNPVPKNQKDSDTFIRKSKEIVINRLIFTKRKNEWFVAKRSRKEYPIYYGKETIFRLCEGNPRFILNIINDVFIKTEKYQDLDDFVFSPDEQVEVVKGVSNRFYAMLKTYPAVVKLKNKNYDLDTLINTVGNYFDEEVNTRKFNMHPATSFFFEPKQTLKEIQELVEIGVSLGAFIKVDKSPEDLSIDKNVRYRLSYLLHPKFKLPLRLYNSVKLNNILSGELNKNSNQLNF